MYSHLTTEVNRAMHPGLRGYTPMLTKNTQGVRGMRGTLGDMPLLNFSLGPGGQFSVGAASVPTATSLWDQVKTWAGESSVIAGVPNSLIGGVGGLLLVAWIFKGGRR